MKSFTIVLKDFFKLNNQNYPEQSNFETTKRKLLIPLYQREYKWTLEKVAALLPDIKKRDKFLGIVILDEADDCYEIVDGQQRITTCFLTLVALYNYYAGSVREQTSLLSHITPYGEYVLQNDSVGDYISVDGTTLTVNVDPTTDIYYQKEAFENSYAKIASFLSQLTPEEVREFKRQFFDCELLIMINDRHGTTRPIEQIFLDINEKAQLLEDENIFKGHCFENFEEEYHQDLKNTWTELKKCGMEFVRNFAYDDVSQYIYHYLLECVDKEMPENLSPNGKHYLDGKTMDQTQECLDDMIRYGNNILSFRNRIRTVDYNFEDLCPDSLRYTNTNDNVILKSMSASLLDYPSAQYQKLPFMQVIDHLSFSDTLKVALTHIEFRRIISNLFIYAVLFVYNGGRKSKKVIDQTVLSELRNESTTGIVLATKTLRTEKVAEFKLNHNTKTDDLKTLYSIVDYYVSNDNWLPKLYNQETNYNVEHFVVPYNSGRIVKWKNEDSEIVIKLPQRVTPLKKRAINFLIIDRYLNEDLKEYDIITKIDMIKSWHVARNLTLPNHIATVINFIEANNEYQTLKALKENPSATIQEIENQYGIFVDSYFEDDSEICLLGQLTEKFKEAFRN